MSIFRMQHQSEKEVERVDEGSSEGRWFGNQNNKVESGRGCGEPL